MSIADIPPSTLEDLQAYVSRGRPCGNFLKAVLSNNLFDAIAHGDDRNRAALEAIVRFIYNDTPAGCWGSEGTYQAWVQKGGLTGRP